MYDLIVAGGGPAGLTAALYAVRYQLSVLVLEGQAFGGQMAQTGKIENYPGSIEEADGPSLADRMRAQAEAAGAKLVMDHIESVDLEGEVKTFHGSKADYQGRAALWAAGSSPRGLGLAKESELVGRGISYCATCDGPFYAGLPVYVVGGGDSAFEEGNYLARIASHVTLIIRKPQARASEILQKRFQEAGNTDIIYNTNVIEFLGDQSLTGFVMENHESGERQTVEGDFGLFIFTGMTPNTQALEGKIDLDHGYLPTNENMETQIPGFFAAGDVRVKKMRQIVTAASDGAIAARAASDYLETLKEGKGA